jgi:hypothetical protein
MSLHAFIFEQGLWIGEGKITFSVSPEHIHFYTRWTVEKVADHLIRSLQEVEMHGSDEKVKNEITFSEMTPHSFLIQLENHLIGSVKGKGIIDEKTIAWEVKGEQGFEGFEVYELQENGDYMMHAEYVSTDQFRTIVDGRIWKKG